MVLEQISRSLAMHHEQKMHERKQRDIFLFTNARGKVTKLLDWLDDIPSFSFFTPKDNGTFLPAQKFLAEIFARDFAFLKIY